MYYPPEPSLKTDDRPHYDAHQAVPSDITGGLALPSAKQLDFQTNHPKGCFFHFGINTFTGQEHGTGDPADQPPSKFAPPVNLDTDQWLQEPQAIIQTINQAPKYLGSVKHRNSCLKDCLR